MMVMVLGRGNDTALQGNGALDMLELNGRMVNVELVEQRLVDLK